MRVEPGEQASEGHKKMLNRELDYARILLTALVFGVIHRNS